MRELTRGAFISIFVSVTALPAFSQSILFDDAHDGNGDELTGNLSGFASVLTSNGISITEFDGSPGDLTPSVLDGYNALFIHDVELDYTSAEITTIVNFVANGGGLFISGNASANFNQATNNALMSNFGITFNESISPQDTVTFTDHPLVDGLSHITGDGVARLLVSGSTELVGFNSSGLGTIAVRDSIAGSGRVVATGDGAPLLNEFLGQADNAEWSLRAAQYVVIPEPSTVFLLSVASLLAMGRRRAT
jgi:hypothetical protein